MLHARGYVLRMLPLCAFISHAQGSSGVVAAMPFVWRDRAQSPATRAGSRPWPCLSCGWDDAGKCKEKFQLYPKTFGMTYVNGLTVSGLRVRHPVTWAIYTCFSNNVRIVGNDVWSDGPST